MRENGALLALDRRRCLRPARVDRCARRVGGSRAAASCDARSLLALGKCEEGIYRNCLEAVITGNNGAEHAKRILGVNLCSRADLGVLLAPAYPRGALRKVN